ncbi:MAG: 2,3-bisphosphoglycerate-independent phosphoglycerate mutase [Bacillota bacterium]|jgi:2,3-bisphosphoglycerate-independent phosphoglycerate mutase
MKPVLLCILDGWALRDAQPGNAVRLAKTPHLDRLFRQHPHCQLQCSGEAVGLMPGQMGDSNVGHLNIGAGRIVYQPLVRINRAIADNSFCKSEVLSAVMQQAEGNSLHLLGLLSDGGVHSHIEHVYALLRLARQRGLQQVYLHIFLDGRDVPPQSALEYISALEAEMERLGVGTIATVMGRFYAMDRDRRWERVQAAYQALVHGQGQRAATASEAVRQSYAAGHTDEFVPPTVICPQGMIKPQDGVFMWNFRADRARELMHALHDPEFAGFPRAELPAPHLAGMMQYEAGYPLPYAIPAQDLHLTLGEVVSQAGKRQLRVAETEKYAHVTFFLNGGREEPFPGEERVLIPSPKVATYDLCPEMSAGRIVEQLLPRLPDYDLVVVNFANLDMVGHTGVLDAAIRAVETVDACVGQLEQALRQLAGAMLVTADHGNAEQMVDLVTGEPHTAHTANPVPCLLVAPGEWKLRPQGILADIAPTVLQLMHLQQPSAMTGQSLIVFDEDR